MCGCDKFRSSLLAGPVSYGDFRDHLKFSTAPKQCKGGSKLSGPMYTYSDGLLENSNAAPLSSAAPGKESNHDHDQFEYCALHISCVLCSLANSQMRAILLERRKHLFANVCCLLTQCSIYSCIHSGENSFVFINSELEAF